MDNLRRRLLVSSLGVPVLGSIPVTASAQSGTPYRALVCVALNGGNDGINTLVPLDEVRYAKYSAARGRLALQRGTGASDLAELPGAGFGLHPSLRSLKSIWDERALAFVNNVGPLARPLTQAEFAIRRDSGDTNFIPQALFSHSDQTLLWEGGYTSTSRNRGWGGMAAAQAAGWNQVISVSGNTRFAVNDDSSALVLPGAGGPTGLRESIDPLRRAAIEAMTSGVHANALQTVYSQKQRAAIDITRRIGGLIQLKPGDPAVHPGINAAFGDVSRSPLSAQLFQVAKLINARDTVGGSQHIFFVSLGGFDTHGQQVSGSAHLGNHADLLAEVAKGVTAFWQAIKSLGMESQVTLCTMSEFGRTLMPNAVGGTDHAWGNLQLVLGGGVNGGALYGRYPEPEVGSSSEAGDPTKPWEHQGRWIPSTSIEQYASPILKWLNPSINLGLIFPNAGNFRLDTHPLMRV